MRALCEGEEKVEMKMNIENFRKCENACVFDDEGVMIIYRGRVIQISVIKYHQNVIEMQMLVTNSKFLLERLELESISC